VTDILLSGGTVVDGTGSPPRRADVAIDGDRIAAVGTDVAPAGAREVIDVTGLVVAPGIVDIHSHADFTLLVDGRAQSSVLQGITTIAVGNCGHGLAPVEPHAVEAARMTTFCCRSEWEHAGAPSSFEDYMGALAAARPAVKVVPLVPHGSLRLNVAGFELRELTRAEIDHLRGLVREAMEAGAAGLSTGLEWGMGSPARSTARSPGSRSRSRTGAGSCARSPTTSATPTPCRWRRPRTG
jgi:N-acyl-D-amino-acid deacylase